MTLSDEDKRLLAETVKNKDVMNLLFKLLVEPETKLTPDLVTKMNDEELGKLVKVDLLAHEKVKTRFDNLKRLAVEVSTTKSPTAPK